MGQRPTGARILVFRAVIALTGAILGATSPPGPEVAAAWAQPSPIPAALDRPFEVPVGQSARIEAARLELSFRVVEADSRCPMGVQCIRAGEVTVRIVITTSGGRRETRSLRAPSRDAATTIDRYRIELRGVAPYPEFNRRIRPDEYVATFLVSREPSQVQ